jgi:hypothetical protein
MIGARPQIEAIQALGYTEQESTFLFLVATHSGYFVARQFLGFTRAHWGKRTTLFWSKLQARQHAQVLRFAHCGTVYHLFSRTLYRQIGQEHHRNRHEHEFAYIRTRIAMLDFVLGNLENRYLETEADKVRYFCTELNVPVHALPSKSYPGRQTPNRYFVDRFPTFFPTAPEASAVIFTYIQGPEANLTGFAHHLRTYLPLFRQLPEFRFLFLARKDWPFDRARGLFRDLVTIPLESSSADDLLRYFAIRKAWDLAQYESVSEGDLMFRNLAKERFSGSRFEHFYRAWKVGRVSDAEIREELHGSDRPHVIQFEAQILKSICGPEAEKAAGELGKSRLLRFISQGASDVHN